MNNQELINKYENKLKDVQLKFGANFKTKVYEELLEELKQLDKPQPTKLKDVIVRIKELDIGARKVWLDEILNEMGSDYGTLKYKDGYEQGKLEGEWVGQQLKDADEIRQELNKPMILQFVADWIRYCKNTGVTLKQALVVGEIVFYNYANQKDLKKLHEFMEDEGNQETFAQAWLFGYTIKEERYLVKLKGVRNTTMVLKCAVNGIWYMGDILEFASIRVYHTRRELEAGGFGEVFNSPLFEVEEVEE